MSIEERLSRLNCKTQSYDATGASHGAMTVSDLCAALAGCDPVGELVIRRKYINPKDKGEGYFSLIRESVMRVYQADKQPKKRNMITPLLDTALNDYMGNNLCKSCNGTGEVLTGGVVRKCRSGTCVDGRTAMKDYQKAKDIGVGAMDFKRNYKPAYEVIENFLTSVLPNAESEALRLIKKQARWNDNE